MSVMFEALLRRANWEQTGPAERLRSNFINGIKHLPVHLTPA
jgi:cholest-4-en-3-one 26-monooxygenase